MRWWVGRLFFFVRWVAGWVRFVLVWVPRWFCLWIWGCCCGAILFRGWFGGWFITFSFPFAFVALWDWCFPSAIGWGSASARWITVGRLGHRLFRVGPCFRVFGDRQGLLVLLPFLASWSWGWLCSFPRSFVVLFWVVRSLRRGSGTGLWVLWVLRGYFYLIFRSFLPIISRVRYIFVWVLWWCSRRRWRVCSFRTLGCCICFWVSSFRCGGRSWPTRLRPAVNLRWSWGCRWECVIFMFFRLFLWVWGGPAGWWCCFWT